MKTLRRRGGGSGQKSRVGGDYCNRKFHSVCQNSTMVPWKAVMAVVKKQLRSYLMESMGENKWAVSWKLKPRTQEQYFSYHNRMTKFQSDWFMLSCYDFCITKSSQSFPVFLWLLSTRERQKKKLYTVEVGFLSKGSPVLCNTITNDFQLVHCNLRQQLIWTTIIDRSSPYNCMVHFLHWIFSHPQPFLLPFPLAGHSSQPKSLLFQ